MAEQLLQSRYWGRRRRNAIATGMALAATGQAEWPGTRGAAGALLVLLAVGLSEIL